MKRTMLNAAMAAIALLLLVMTGRSVEGISRKKLELEALYLPSGKFIEQASLGYRNLAADLLWLKTVQHYGGFRRGENHLTHFQHLIEVITDLDPQFTFAYIFGAIIISEDLDYYAGAVELLEKGMWNNPGDWYFPFEIGFIYYIEARDYENAERYFLLAARVPGAESIAGRFAAYVAQKAGHLETSIAMWEELARTTSKPAIRELAERSIEKLKHRLAEEKHE